VKTGSILFIICNNDSLRNSGLDFAIKVCIASSLYGTMLCVVHAGRRATCRLPLSIYVTVACILLVVSS
jgi:hypothetical protein